MARPGFSKHRKLLRLARTLGIPEAHALGLCEMLWQSAYEVAHPRLGDADDVEAAARWTGQPGALAAAMLRCGGGLEPGLVEQDEAGDFWVHDFWDHAPQYVKRRAERENQRRANGRSVASQRLDSGASMASQRLVAGLPVTSTPTPTPTPSLIPDTLAHPDPAPQPVAASGRPARPAASLRGFDRFWAAYPRKIGKGAAERAWRKIKPNDELASAIVASVEAHKRCNDWLRGLEYVCHPTTFLNQRRWEDSLDQEDLHGPRDDTPF